MASRPMHAPQPAPPPKIGSILLLGGLTAMGAVSIDLYLPSLPAIGVALHADPAAVQQSMAAFFIGMAIGQLIYGPVSDRIGRRPALLVGAVIYVAASLACAAAPSIGWLVAFRFIQALGACAGQVVARAVVRDRYDHQDSARIFSLMTLVLGVAPLLAPSVGAWLVTFVSWRSIFLALAAIGTVIGIATGLRLTESRSAATAAMARDESVTASFFGLLRHSRLLGYLLANALNGATLFTYISAGPDLLITNYGFTAREFGWVFASMGVGVIGSSQVNRFLLKRFSSDRILGVASLGGIAAGAGLLAAAVTGIGGVWGLLPMLFCALTSFGFMASNTTAGALSVDPVRAGATSALIGSASFGVGALASIVAGWFHNGTAVPMAAVMLASLIGAGVALFTLALPRGAERSDP
ncbi:MAG: multidrug effflux MFS transporter [Janthinobacterium lividum]